MTVIIISTSELNKFPLKFGDSMFWQPNNNTVSGYYWLQLEAQSDLDKHEIKYTIGEVEIREENG